MTSWRINRVINFSDEKAWREGYTHFGFHDLKGNQYVLDYDQGWLGLLEGDNLVWTIGAKRIGNESKHYYLDMEKTKYLEGEENGSIIFSEENRVFRFNPKAEKLDLIIDKNEFGIKDIGNCVYDNEGNIWINEITGCRVWQFDYHGNLIKTLGNGKPGFRKEVTSFEEVQFNWIYDLKRGVDGNIYVLDSKNYSVRMIDISEQVVKLVAGTGKGGYSGDGDSALEATFGSNKEAQFDGPWSMAIDEVGNIYIGDTQNHVVRMIDSKNNQIRTIAGNPEIMIGKRNSINEVNPLKLNLPLICSMDYWDGLLFIPEMGGDLILLEKDLK